MHWEKIKLLETLTQPSSGVWNNLILGKVNGIYCQYIHIVFQGTIWHILLLTPYIKWSQFLRLLAPLLTGIFLKKAGYCFFERLITNRAHWSCCCLLSMHSLRIQWYNEVKGWWNPSFCSLTFRFFPEIKTPHLCCKIWQEWIVICRSTTTLTSVTTL